MKSKHKKPKANKFPQNALAFYIQLYCKRKGSTKSKYYSNLVEATKSWLFLSEAEKQQFNMQYKECEHKFKLQYFNQLKFAEPFMKVKDSRVDDVALKNSNLANQEPEDYTEEDKQPQDIHKEVQQVEQMENEEITVGSEAEFVTNVEMQQDLNDQNEIINDPKDNHKLNTRTFLVEPLPPTLRTGKDLFHMLNSTDDTINSTWTSLPQVERNQYSRAVFLLKKDYITKYKEYLETLTPRELYDYYNKIVF